MTRNDLIGVAGFIGLNSAFVICLIIVLCAALYLVMRKDNLVHMIETLSFFQLGCFLLAVGSLAALLQVNAFEYPLVFDAVENGMRWHQKLGGLWSGQANSLLFWSAMMSCGAAASIGVAKKTTRLEYIPAAVGILQFILLFFIIPIVFFAQPFNRLWAVPNQGFIEAVFPPQDSSLIVPIDGLGMNPSLRHIAMLLHPPFLYLGLIGFFIPYAFAISALIMRDGKSEWIQYCFGFAVGAWTCLTIGMFLGSWWAYTILGWGGYWGWDAVEISGLLPWILSFGLVHSMRMHIRQRKADRWVYALSAMIVILILFGVLLTRSGLIESVHAYSAGAMGPVLTVLIGINILAAAGLALKRRDMFADGEPEKIFRTQDRLIIILNKIILILAGIYLFGQTLPLTSRMFTQQSRSFSPAQYVFYSAPVLLALLIVSALCPSAQMWEDDRKKFWRVNAALAGAAIIITLFFLMQWNIQPFSALGFWACAYLLVCWLYAFWKDVIQPAAKHRLAAGKVMRGRLGSIIIHLGFGVMSLGILGAENLEQHAEISLGIMESVRTDFLTLETRSIREVQVHSGQTDYELDILVDEQGRQFGLTPVLEYFNKRDMYHAQPAIHANASRDVQVVMTALPDGLEQKATLMIYMFPLMSWIWTGGALMVLGGSIQLFQLLKRQV